MTKAAPPLGPPGLIGSYWHPRAGDLPPSTVEEFKLGYQAVEDGRPPRQWLQVEAKRADGAVFQAWLLTRRFPPVGTEAARRTVSRYILDGGKSLALEYRDELDGGSVLPELGAWKHLIPRPGKPRRGSDFGERARYLGHEYVFESAEASEVDPPQSKTLDLGPNVLVGQAHNTRQKDETRLWDDSDYELVRLTKDDYDRMILAGMNCFHVDREQAEWILDREVFHWGLGGSDLEYPQHLYRSNYLGPTIFLDEPAVCTRDHVIRPRLEKDAAFRNSITPQAAFEEFQGYFKKAKYQGAATRLISQLSARSDVDIGSMDFLQQNLYTWETMVSTAGYQLTEGPGPPKAVVFEPPGRVGTMRTLPEMNMAYGCQIPVDDPKNLASIIYGFTRGAARASKGSWGMSVYGQFHRSDAFWFQTHAYDLGAKFFMYWDSYQLACVPFGECLALSRNLRGHVQSHPRRELDELREAAEVVILLPPGYNLGHVDLGRGNLWGIGELNLERENRAGIKYREVMCNFFTEIERCLREGVAFDLIWDLEGIDLAGYREIVRIMEDGDVEVSSAGDTLRVRGPRTPPRPHEHPPKLSVRLASKAEGSGWKVTASAEIARGSSPIYYTLGADKTGVYENQAVMWELYGPEEPDYRFLTWEVGRSPAKRSKAGMRSEIAFAVKRPGSYRLRAATADLAGRTCVVWMSFSLKAAS